MSSGAQALAQLNTPRVQTRVAQRRAVAVASWDDLEREIDRVERASRPEGEGLRVTGNWSAGQILDHLARAIERSMDGFSEGPASRRPDMAALNRWESLGARAAAARAAIQESDRKSKMLGLPMEPAGPGVASPGELEPAAQVWTNDGAARVRAVMGRIRDKHPMDKPSPTLGPMTAQEWQAFHLRHAELHLSFVLLGSWR